MNNSDNDIYDVIKFYNDKLKNFRYTYECMFNIKIDFNIKPEEVCHLLFGSVSRKNVPNSKLYKGIKGYDNIINKKITNTNIPYQIRKDYNVKSSAFLCLPTLLENPTALFFNSKIVDKGSIKRLGTTSIDADFLLYKKINNKNIHLFLKWSPEKRELVPYSLIHNNKNNYIINQKQIKIVKKYKKHII